MIPTTEFRSIIGKRIENIFIQQNDGVEEFVIIELKNGMYFKISQWEAPTLCGTEITLYDKDNNYKEELFIF